MAKLHQKTSPTKQGFSLIEIVVALVILSTSILVIYNLISSTSSSVFKLDDYYHSKEVANNRIALIHTVEKPKQVSNRSGYMNMGGKEWLWEEKFKTLESGELIRYEIFIKPTDSNEYSYRSEGYLINE